MEVDKDKGRKRKTSFL